MHYSERLSPYGPSLSEALGGSLPSIDVIQIGLADRLQDHSEIDQRIDEIVNLVAEQKSRTHYDYDKNPNGFLNPKRDSLALLFLDGLSYLANMHKVHRQIKLNKQKFGSANGSQMDLQDLTEARYDIHSSLMSFGLAYDTASDDLKHQAVSNIFYESLCLIYDRQDIRDDEDNTNNDFIGLIGENKVLALLKNGRWPNAYYGSNLDEHRFASDIVVPLGELRDKRKLYIQVKSSSVVGSEFFVKEMPQAHNQLLVNIPLGGDNGWFDWLPKQRRQLEEAISSY